MEISAAVLTISSKRLFHLRPHVRHVMEDLSLAAASSPTQNDPKVAEVKLQSVSMSSQIHICDQCCRYALRALRRAPCAGGGTKTA